MIRPLDSNDHLITTGQIRAARALMGWSQQELADRSGISRRTIAAAEAVEPSATTTRAVVECFEDAGIHFITDSTGRGVYLSTPTSVPLSVVGSEPK